MESGFVTIESIVAFSASLSRASLLTINLRTLPFSLFLYLSGSLIISGISIVSQMYFLLPSEKMGRETK